MFGGGYDKSLYASLHQLETESMTWTHLSPQQDGGPMRKQGCQMLHNNNSLIVIGGHGLPFDVLQPGSQLTKDTKFRDRRGWTNEIHMYNLSQGMWSTTKPYNKSIKKNFFWLSIIEQ